MCVGVRCGKPCCFVLYFTAGGIVHQQGPKLKILMMVSGIRNFKEKQCPMPGTQGESAQNAKGPELVDHPVDVFFFAMCAFPSSLQCTYLEQRALLVDPLLFLFLHFFKLLFFDLQKVARTENKGPFPGNPCFEIGPPKRPKGPLRWERFPEVIHSGFWRRPKDQCFQGTP